jgi:hypothetical protein
MDNIGSMLAAAIFAQRQGGPEGAHLSAAAGRISGVLEALTSSAAASCPAAPATQLLSLPASLSAALADPATTPTALGGDELLRLILAQQQVMAPALLAASQPLAAAASQPPAAAAALPDIFKLFSNDQLAALLAATSGAASAAALPLPQLPPQLPLKRGREDEDAATLLRRLIVQQQEQQQSQLELDALRAPPPLTPLQQLQQLQQIEAAGGLAQLAGLPVIGGGAGAYSSSVDTNNDRATNTRSTKPRFAGRASPSAAAPPDAGAGGSASDPNVPPKTVAVREKNRAAQRRFRERQREYLTNLQVEVEELRSVVEEQRREIAGLKHANAQLAAAAGGDGGASDGGAAAAAGAVAPPVTPEAVAAALAADAGAGAGAGAPAGVMELLALRARMDAGA